MNWGSVQESWNEFRGLVTAERGEHSVGDSRTSRERRVAYLCKRYGMSKDEANRKMDDWIKDPGVLDDWNDTRSILDM